ncbi:hypothetical protein QOZ80_3BG0267480 [Eleusine coracana subsp. coracana]|nr:hypothetical protein QOZ80_3BG0267480 [Eleusine coracana subsp. coracana]
MLQQQQDDEDLVRLLPDDAVADVLRRLGPCDLAASRCVSKTWCGIMDARHLMLPHLLPHEVGGIFIDFNNLHSWEFFARPTTGPEISGEFDFLPSGAESEILDYCNGLFLSDDCVFNPATRRWTPLPPRPPQPASESLYFSQSEYLVFDPTVSPHFEVFIIPSRIIYKKKPGDYCYRPSRDKLDPETEQSEWPPSPWILHVFTSRTGQWEERSFFRDGEPAGTVNDMRKAYPWTHKRYAAYSQGELYVHCQADFTARYLLLFLDYLYRTIGVK